MNFEVAQVGKSAIKLLVGLVVTASFSMLALPAVAQQDEESQEVCKNMALEIVYASKPPLNLKVYKVGGSGPLPMFPSSYSNVNSVVSYSAEFAEMSDDPHAPRIKLPSDKKIIKYSATGGCGFNMSGKLVAIRITSANIWRDSKDFQDYGKVQDFGRLIVIRRGVSANESDSTVKTFSVIANGKREAWVTDCRTSQVERSVEQPMEKNVLTASVSKYICTK
jgi:hypothetical protein